MDPSAEPKNALHDSANAASSSLPKPEEVRWRADEILRGGNEAFIVHGELVYRLRLTRSGKLILFK